MNLIQDTSEDHPDGRFSILRTEEEGRCVTVELIDEDHTLGNALRHMIQKNPEVKFCGYALPHPNERKINIQIQVYKGEALDALEKGLKDLRDLNRVVLQRLTEASRKFGPVELIDSEDEDEQRHTHPQFSTKMHGKLDSIDELKGVESTLKGLNEQQVSLIRETGDLFKKQVDYIKIIDDLESSRPNMQRVENSIKHLSSMLSSVSQNDDDMCSKLRRMDKVKARIDYFLSKVDGILNLRTCHDAVNDAIEASNYEEAAMLIKKFLSIDRDELEKTIRVINNLSGRKINSSLLTELIEYDTTESGENKPAKMRRTSDIVALDDMDDARLKMLIICQDNLTKAIKESDTKNIDRFFKIFPMLNEHEDGLKRYAEYLKSKIMSPGLEEIVKSKTVNQADKLAALFENIAKLIDQNQPLIETYCGPGHLMVVVRVLQGECDLLSRRILEEFRNETKLQFVAKVVKNSSMQILANTNYANQQTTLTSSSSGTQLSSLNLQPSKLDPLDVDKILNEISTIISRSEVYLNFLATRIRDDIECKSDDEAARQASSLDLYNLLCTNCELNHLVQEVGGIYVMLEQFYLNESSKKAITMDQIDADPMGYCLSSMLDDIFFIIKKCLKRSISTKSSEVFCAITNHCVTFLEFTFCQILAHRLGSQYYSIAPFIGDNNIMSKAYNAIQAGRYMQSANEIELAKAQYFSALNNLDRARDYIQTLKEILEKDVTKLRPLILILKKHQDNQLEKSLTCLDELSGLKAKFSHVINNSIEEMFNSSIRNRLKIELKEIDNNETISQNLQSNYISGLTESLMLSLDKSLSSIMTEANYSRLLLVAQQFVSLTLKSSQKPNN